MRCIALSYRNKPLCLTNSQAKILKAAFVDEYSYTKRAVLKNADQRAYREKKDNPLGVSQADQRS
jgi:hypothetical protein